MIDDAESVRFYRCSTPKAKKIHKCNECRRMIQPGETYQYSVGCWDDFRVYKTCSHCLVAVRWLNKHCGGSVHTGVKADLQEHWDEGYREDNLQKLIMGMNRGWKSFRGEGLLDIPEEIK
jgi:hypothetical protein